MDSKEIGKILGPMFDMIAAESTVALRELALPAHAEVLDVGTGGGNSAIYLATQNYQVLTGEPATDTSRYAGKDWALNAEKAGVRDRIRFQAFDAGNMPFAAQSFDAVFFFGVLHHIDENIRHDVLSEALRVTRKNGAVVFFEPRPEMLEKIWANNPDHPQSADPSVYCGGQKVSLRQLQGALMDIFIFTHAA